MSQNDPIQNPPRVSIPPIEFTAGGPTDEIKKANFEAVQPSPGFVSLAILTADAITKRADLVLLDYTQSGANIRYKVDGVWHPMAPMDRESGDFMLASLKRLANMIHLERVQRQQGSFVAMYLKYKHKCEVTSQGVPTGERIVIVIGREKPPVDTLKKMGMRYRQYQQLIETINQDRLLVLGSSMPDDFAEPFWRALQSAGDRFMRDFFAIHDVKKPVEEIINIAPVTYDAADEKGLEKAIRGLLLREPNVVTFSELNSANTLNQATQLVLKNDIAVFARVSGRDVFDAILRTLVLKPDVEKFAQSLVCVVSQRTIRLLCDHCRQPFAPNQQLLKQLGLPPQRVNTMYTHFQPRAEDLADENGNPIDWEPCPKCGGPGYFERTSLFELLMVDDKIRKVILNKPTRQTLMDAAAGSPHVSIRDEGVLKIAKGETSLEELRRVLKQ